MSVFAEAYRRQKGADWSKEESMNQLYETFKPGKNINTAALAPFLTEVLREKAAPKLEKAMTTSAAWQGRFQNARNQWVEEFGRGGGESGYRNLFMAGTGVVESLNGGAAGELWDKLTNAATGMPLAYSDLRNALSGEDSYIEKIFGKDYIENLRKNSEAMDRFSSTIMGWLGSGKGPSDGGRLTPTLRMVKATTNTKNLLGSIVGIGSRVGESDWYKPALEAIANAREAYLGTPYTLLTGRQSLSGDFGSISMSFKEHLDSNLEANRTYWENYNNSFDLNSTGRQNSEIKIDNFSINMQADDVGSLDDLAQRLKDEITTATMFSAPDN